MGTAAVTRVWRDPRWQSQDETGFTFFVFPLRFNDGSPGADMSDDPELRQFEEEEAGDQPADLGCPLPDGWHKMRDPNNGKIFYVNHDKQLRSWVDPRRAVEGVIKPGQLLQKDEREEVMAGHVRVGFDLSQMPPEATMPAGARINTLRYLPPGDVNDKRLLEGAHALNQMYEEPSHLLDHPPDQIWSMNGQPNTASNQASAFRSSLNGAIGTPLNSLDFSVQRAVPPDGTVHTAGSVSVVPLGSGGFSSLPPGPPKDIGEVVHPVYLTTERVTYTAPRGNLDTSYDSRDGKYHARRSLSPAYDTRGGVYDSMRSLDPSHIKGGSISNIRDSFLSNSDMYVSNRSVNAHKDMHASNRSINDSRGGGTDISYTEQLAASLDPVNNMLHSTDRCYL